MTVHVHDTRTRVIVIAHSHETGEVDVSRDVIGFETGKVTKRAGSMKLILSPGRNYLNVLFPNDLINFYIDTGEGHGFVRTFFGYIDAVEESSVTFGAAGSERTVYVVECTDFQKAIEATSIYFNPGLRGRSDLVLHPEFSKSNVGGVALMTSGLILWGSPSEIVESLLTTMLGFGSQLELPESYPENTPVEWARRASIRRNALARLPSSARSHLPYSESVGLTEDLDPAEAIEDALRLKIAEANKTADEKTRRAKLEQLLSDDFSIAGLLKVLRRTADLAPRTLLDLLDLNFIEHHSVDGFTGNVGLSRTSGTIAQVLYGYTNEMVNELLFDLRPVAAGQDSVYGDAIRKNTYTSSPLAALLTTPPGYSRDDDELGINTHGTTELRAEAPAVQYVPAVSFREYPFSTAEGLDLSKFYIMDGQAEVGFLPFGPVFSQRPLNGRSGRAIYDYRNVSGTERLSRSFVNSAQDRLPIKHLDVVTIHTNETRSRSLRRSDAQVLNLINVLDAGPTNLMWKFELLALMPVGNPVSISRHGLRYIELASRYSMVPGDVTNLDRDNAKSRRTLARWGLLFDHWHQHNAEYLAGNVVCRLRPDIRVGYRLDWEDRNESYYVDGVAHHGEYREGVWHTQTTLSLSRGQRNDPYPLYVPPQVGKSAGGKAARTKVEVRTLDPTGAPGGTVVGGAEPTMTVESPFSIAGGGNRRLDGRLARTFRVKDPPAVEDGSEDSQERSDVERERYNGVVQGAS
jgi:hypothetical protein